MDGWETASIVCSNHPGVEHRKSHARIPRRTCLEHCSFVTVPGPSSSTKRTASRPPSLCAAPSTTKAAAVRKMGGNLDTAVVPCTRSHEDGATQDYLTERQSVLLSGNPFTPPSPLHRSGICSRCIEPFQDDTESVILIVRWASGEAPILEIAGAAIQAIE